MDKEIITIEEAKAENIYSAIWGSRQHPGVSLENIAAICAKIFDEAELEAFIRELQQESGILYNSCEKCGGELGRKAIGDETYDTCIDCGRVKH